MKWEKVRLGDVAISIQTGPFGSQLHQSDYSDSGIPVVMPKDLINGKISDLSIARVSIEHVERLSRHIIKTGDILYSRRGDVGRCAFASFYEQGWLCGTGCLKVTIDEKWAVAKFIFYQLQKKDIIGWVINHAVGSTMLNLNTSILNNVPIYLPPIDIQNKIANILSAYDDLIENNQKQIKLLEEAAQRLYKEWFVDLRFPGHEQVKIVDGVPEGWKEEKIEDFFDISIGKTPPRTEVQCFRNGNDGIPWVSISDMGSSDVFLFYTNENLSADAISKYNVKVVPAGTILLSFKLTVGRVSITGTEMCTNEAIAHFKINDDCMKEYTYMYLKNFHFDTLGSTSSISKAINSKIVKSMPFTMPEYSIIRKFSDRCRQIFLQIKIRQQMNRDLQEARDRLLPKLMSGEIEV